MISTSTRLTIGSAIGFITGLGVLGLSTADAQYLSGSIDSVIGGVIAIVSLAGFIEHHLQKHAADKTTLTITGATQPVTA